MTILMISHDDADYFKRTAVLLCKAYLLSVVHINMLV